MLPGKAKNGGIADSASAARSADSPAPEQSADSAPPVAQSRTKRDANGYVIDDPEVKKLFDGKTIYFTTDINLFGSLLDYPNSFKMAGATLATVGDGFDLFLVAQKEYEGVVSASLHYSKLGQYYYEETSRSYAAVLDDDSTLLFNSAGRAELVSRDENAVKNATKEALQEQSSKFFAEIKQAKSKESARKQIAENETFFRSGEMVAAKKDSVLEAQFLKVLRKANSAPSVPEDERASYNKVLLIFDHWSVEKDGLGNPTKMTYAAWAIGNYNKDKSCFFQKLYMKKVHQGGGKYGDVQFDEGERPSIISCDLLK